MFRGCPVHLVLGRARQATFVTRAPHQPHKASDTCARAAMQVYCFMLIYSRVCARVCFSAGAAPCNGSSMYCPRGSARMSVSAGYYSTPLTTDVLHRSGQAACEAGYYCVDGVRYECAGGRYSTALLLSSPCMTLCEAGVCVL